MTVTRKKRLSGKGLVCPDCGKKTSRVDICESCGYPMLKDIEAKLINSKKTGTEKDTCQSEVERLAAIGEARKKAQENLESILVEQRVQRQAKIKKYGVRNVVDIENDDDVMLALERHKEKLLELYPVNEPYAYIAIIASQPPTYQVCEVTLTKGEEDLLKEIKVWLYEVINVDFTSLDKTEDLLRQKVQEITGEFDIRLDDLSMEKIMYYLTRDMVGYGRLDPILRDKKIEDISADGPGIPVYVYHQTYGSLETNIIFSQEELDSLIYKLAQRSGRHISVARPLLDASLPSQDRLQLSIGSQVTTKGSTFTIRKFRETPFTPIDLINLGTISAEMAVYFWLAVENGFNILISGGTASGKTTFLNSISMFIPPNSKIVSLEDTREINLLHENWIPSVTRDTEERGSIEMFDLLRTALRQRPEYLLVGEVRGREAYTLFQAMSTGHITFSTVHADSVPSLVKRLTKPPIDIPLMLLECIDIVALVSMVKAGDKKARRCTNVVEVTDVDFTNETLKTNTVFRSTDGSYQFSGESKVFLEIMEKQNMNEEKLSAEFSRRLRIMSRLREKKVNDFYTFSRLLVNYSIHPDEVEKELFQGVET